MPDEVIVVDNNSTDKTVKIAKNYPFVKVLHEKRQHQVFAQRKGFNSATSDILGRIDADSIIQKDWVQIVKNHFENNPGTLAVTGTGAPYDVSLKKTAKLFFTAFHEYFSRFISGHTMLWGANMAMRADTWEKIKRQVHYRTDFWEDYDLSFHIIKYGTIEFLPDLTIECSYRVVNKTVLGQMEYTIRGIKTFSAHVNMLKSLIVMITWSVVICIYFPLVLVDRIVLKLKKPRGLRGF